LPRGSRLAGKVQSKNFLFLSGVNNMQLKKIEIIFDKKTILIAGIVFAASIVFHAISVQKLSGSALEFVISSHFFSFLLFFCFASKIKTIKRLLLCCIIIPLLCGALYSVSHIIVQFIGDLKLPEIKDIADIIIVSSGVFLYISIGWTISVSLVFFCCFCLFLQKFNKPFSDEKHLLNPSIFQRNLITFELFKCSKLSLVVWLVYIMFMILYYYIFKQQWEIDRRVVAHKVFANAIPVCLLSFFSIIYLIPVFFNKIKKLIVCCILLPLFWSVLIHIIHGMLKFIIERNTNYFDERVLYVDFYFHRYIETRAWFISLLLMLICGIYYYFAKSESIKNAQESHPRK
jgi:hypothetical protein